MFQKTLSTGPAIGPLPLRILDWSRRSYSTAFRDDEQLVRFEISEARTNDTNENVSKSTAEERGTYIKEAWIFGMKVWEKPSPSLAGGSRESFEC